MRGCIVGLHNCAKQKQPVSIDERPAVYPQYQGPAVGNVWHSALRGMEHSSLSKHCWPCLVSLQSFSVPVTMSREEVLTSSFPRGSSPPGATTTQRFAFLTASKDKSQPCPFSKAGLICSKFQESPKLIICFE